MKNNGPDHSPLGPLSGFVPNHEVRALTGLRGVAALDVVIGHYNIHMNAFIHPFDFADSAVDLFFCLSSFTLCMVYLGGGKRFELGSFAIARFARIYPLFILMMIVCLIAGYGWGDEAFPEFKNAFILRHSLDQLTMLAALPIKSLSGFWNPAAWSVGIEVMCYIFLFPIFAAFWPKLLRVSPRLLLTTAICSSLICHFTFVRDYYPGVNGIGYPPPANAFAYWVALIRGISMFSAGAFVFAAYQAHRELRQATGLMTDAVMMLIIAINAGELYGFLNRHAMVVLVPLLIMGLMDDRSVTARLLASPPLHFLGLISYSIYLWHLPVYWIIMHFCPALIPMESMRILIPLMVAIIWATISYYLYETPARRLIRKFSRLPQLLPLQQRA